jgi:hypothetical protein
MVKNTKGGKGAKSMARKSFTASTADLPVPKSELELFAVVSKIYGPTCDVLLHDGTQLLCHIRKKFKGRRKSGNLISVGNILLVGLRDWEPDSSRKNCDLIFVYDSIQTSSLNERFSLPSLPSSFASFDHITFDSNYELTSHLHDSSHLPSHLPSPTPIHQHDLHNDFHNL